MNQRFFFNFLFLLALVSFGHKASSQVLQDYTNDWETGKDESWVSPNDRLVLPLDLKTFPLANIAFEFPEKSVVFIGEKLWVYSQADTTFSRSIMDLSKEFGTDEIELTVFKKGISLGDASVKKVLKPKAEKSLGKSEGELVMQQREFNRQDLRDFYFVAVFVILLIMAFYKVAYPYLFASMIRPDSLITAEDFSDTGSLQKFFSMDVLFYILMVNLMAALVGVIGLVFYRIEWLEVWFGVDYNSLISLWLIGTFGFFLLTMIKFVGIRVFAYLFDLGKLEFAHFFYLLRLVVMTVAALVLIIAFFLVNDFSASKEAIGVSLSAFFWVYIIGVLGLFFIMMNRLSFKKYHLFTYLCIAELVPFLIIAKWIMILGQ